MHSQVDASPVELAIAFFTAATAVVNFPPLNGLRLHDLLPALRAYLTSEDAAVTGYLDPTQQDAARSGASNEKFR
jgi:hypothetical protein